jgi:hypothetical protein
MGSNTTNGTVPPEFPSQVCQVHHSTMHSRKMLMDPLHSTTLFVRYIQHGATDNNLNIHDGLAYK